MNPTPQPPDELDRRLDAALRRHFEAPARLTLPTPRGRVPRRRLAFLLLAAAAIALGLGLWRFWPRSAPARFERLTPERFARHENLAPATCSVGPLEEHREPARVQAPDLVALYTSMDACQRSSAAVACGESDALLERLRASYGPDVALRPEAAGLLHGPFASLEWPTGTILTGSSEDVTSVLVAERDATLDCCVRMRLAAESGLNVFSWSVGDLALTEITQHAEPRLLPFFE